MSPPSPHGHCIPDNMEARQVPDLNAVLCQNPTLTDRILSVFGGDG